MSYISVIKVDFCVWIEGLNSTAPSGTLNSLVHHVHRHILESVTTIMARHGVVAVCVLILASSALAVRPQNPFTDHTALSSV